MMRPSRIAAFGLVVGALGLPSQHTHAQAAQAASRGLSVTEAARFTNWVPAGWYLAYCSTGDLNRDGRADAVLVLDRQALARTQSSDNSESRAPDATESRAPDATAASETDPPVADPEDSPTPRRLMILLDTEAGYRKALETDRFLPELLPARKSCVDDPLSDGGISIARGVLHVNLHFWSSCGSYGVSDVHFAFRLDTSRWRLIGLDRSEFMRNSGERSERSLNFLTGRERNKVFNEFDDRPVVARGTRFDNSRQHFLDELRCDCSLPEPCDP